MTQNTEYVSLEYCCSMLKVSAPAVLGDIAEQLRSILDPLSELNPLTVYAGAGHDPHDRPPITYLDLSNYFLKATGKHVPVLFETPFQVVESHNVMVSREWLQTKVVAARERLGLIKPVQAEKAYSAQLLKLANSNFISTYEEQPAALDTNAYKELHRKLAVQSDQRKAQEAASKDAIARRDAENRTVVLEALLAESRAKEKALMDENRSLYNEITAKDRKIQDKELEIEALSERLLTFVSCFNPHSALHPAALSEAFDCWNDLTQFGTFDPSGPGGRGAKSLVLEWLRARGETDIGTLSKPSAKVKRLAVVIGWRGAGSGAIRSK
jgi:hypothetical protein